MSKRSGAATCMTTPALPRDSVHVQEDASATVAILESPISRCLDVLDRTIACIAQSTASAEVEAATGPLIISVSAAWHVVTELVRGDLGH